MSMTYYAARMILERESGVVHVETTSEAVRMYQLS
jgi:hypothetical protein